MSRIMVVGNVNVETTVRVESFPIEYQPVTFAPFGIGNAVSGVGYNLAMALTTLGDDVAFAALVGRDKIGALIRETLSTGGIDDRLVLGQVENSPLSLILYDAAGKRAVFVDVKDLMEQRYPEDLFRAALTDREAVLFTQVGYCAPLLAPARETGKLIAADLQLIVALEEPYKRQYLEAVAIIFMSDSRLPEPPAAWVEHLLDRYANLQIVVVGMGADGSLLATRDGLRLQVPAVNTRPIVNTSGAGDALFASFMHYYVATHDAATALRKATVFASYKIGAASSSEGFLDQAGVEELYSSP